MVPEYAIGLTYPPTPFLSYSPPIPWPQKSSPELYSVAFDRADGTRAGHGYPYTTLLWQFLEQNELDHLLGLLTVSGTLRKSRSGLYLRTIKPGDEDAWATYTCVMLLPDNLSSYRQPGGYYAGIPLEFRRLVAYP